jgi:hypothetical protein
MIITTPEEISRRVALGAEWLDSEFGPDWDTYVEPEYLDMSSGMRCILGQTAPELMQAYQPCSDDGYQQAVGEYSGTDFNDVEWTPEAFGFTTYGEDVADDGTHSEVWAMLDCAWTALLYARKEARDAAAD